MENHELQKIWKTIDSKIESRSEDELQKILESKIQIIMRRFYITNIAVFIVTCGFFVFLTISLVDRWDDIYYRINNLSIGVVSLIALVSEVLTIRMLRRNKSAHNLKEWIEKSMFYINKEVKQRLSYYILPFIAIPSILSIHVYFSQDSFIGIFHDEESIYGLIFGFIIALAVGYVFISKYLKYQFKNLKNLQDLYDRL